MSDSAGQGAGDRKVAWGIMGTGNIASKFAAGVLASKTGRLAAVGSRTIESAERFGDRFNVPTRHGSYEALLADPEVQAVYISLPNSLHSYWTIKAAEAKKAILCEKPFATNLAEAQAAIDAVKANGVFFMEAFMYRCHPQIERLVGLLREKAVGDVRVIEAVHSFNMGGEKPENIRQQNGVAGGGMMDVGCYAVSAARLVAGAAVGQDFAEPTDVKAVAHVGANSRIDEWSTAVFRFPGDILATLTCGIQLSMRSAIRVWGSQGHIVLPSPWNPNPDEGKVLIYRDGQAEAEVIEVPVDRPTYALEADTVAAYIGGVQAKPPAMTWEDTLGNQRALDMWRRDIGLVFDNER